MWKCECICICIHTQIFSKLRHVQKQQSINKWESDLDQPIETNLCCPYRHEYRAYPPEHSNPHAWLLLLRCCCGSGSTLCYVWSFKLKVVELDSDRTFERSKGKSFRGIPLNLIKLFLLGFLLQNFEPRLTFSLYWLLYWDVIPLPTGTLAITVTHKTLARAYVILARILTSKTDKNKTFKTEI